MGSQNGLVEGTAILVDLLVLPVLPIVLVPTALYLFTSSLAAEFAFTITWWFVVGVNAVLFLAGAWRISEQSSWYLAPVSLAVLAAAPIKRKWKPPPPEPPIDETPPPAGHV